MKKRKRNRTSAQRAASFIIMFAAALVFAPAGEAAIQNASSCSQANVQSAINAASDGDTVMIPAGSCTWSSTVSTANKRITLQGAGHTQTQITVATCTSPGLSINNAAGKTITVSGIRFKGSVYDAGIIQVNGTVKDFRITNNYFDWTSSTCGSGWHDDVAIFVKGTANGLIDHNTFAPSVAQDYKSAIKIFADSISNAFSRPSAIGTAHSVYIEDNTFIQSKYTNMTHALWGQQGGSYVFRYNTVTNYGLDMHGQCSSQGGREFEVYNNRFIATANYGNKTIMIRGGTGVIFNNTYTSNGNTMYGEGLRMQEVDWGSNCNSAAGGACHACNYPAQYQPGRGTDNSSDPIYMWNNKLDGKYWLINDSNAIWPDTFDSGCLSACGRTVLPHTMTAFNRDYFSSENTARPGYSPYTYPHPLAGGVSTTPKAPVNLKAD